MSLLKIGDRVSFRLAGQNYTGFIDKEYQNSFMITFNSDDVEVINEYHDRIVINKKQVKLIKDASNTIVGKVPEIDERQ